MTFTAHRLPESQIVWWCAECGTYTLEHEKACPMDCMTAGGHDSKQRRRRGYICADCEEHVYLSRESFVESHRGD
jgi:hypothetical protein